MIKVDTADKAQLKIPTDASKVFKPAFEAAQAYADIFGYSLSYKGGALAKEFGAPKVIVPNQLQEITLTPKKGKAAMIGSVLPEAVHMGKLKTEAALEKELLGLVDGFRAKLPKTSPFHGNAASSFLPAIEQASAYAKLKGFKAVTFEGTGINAKSMGPPTVSATELQQLTLVDAHGKKHKLGQILPEADHIKTLKTTNVLFDAMRKMVDDYAKKSAS